jgi:two-component system chemotaxis sensor kinase CheA
MTLRGRHEGGQVSMKDDEGAGIDTAVRVKEKAVEKGLLRPEQAAKLGDRETLNLILEPEFSTAQVVTKLLGWSSALPSVKNHILFNPIV